MRALRILDSARDDIARIYRFIEQESGNSKLAEGFARRLNEQCRKLSQLPGTLGVARPELRPDIRCFPFRGYLIFFRYAPEETLEIVAILEGHRDVIAAFGGDD